MQLVEFKEDTVYLNWDDISEDRIRFDIDLRDKIFKELQDAFRENIINSTILFQMNEFVIKKIKDIKQDIVKK